MSVSGGRHFLQIPGPTNVPDRVLRAMSAPTIDHRGPQFAEFTTDLLGRLGPLFGCAGPVVIFPSSGTGAWEAALANTLNPGDTVLGFDIGHFAALWQELAGKLGLKAELVPGDWRQGVRPESVAERLAADTGHQIKAVLVVHNETSTGVTSRVAEIRAAIDAAEHPALLLVDAISSLGSVEFRHDDWGVDVTIAGSQKGLMLPPGLGFNAVSEKALEASRTASLPRGYFEWAPILRANESGSFPYTPATNLLYGLREAVDMLHEEGLPAVFGRHIRHGTATRAAAAQWGLELVSTDAREHSPVLTALYTPDGVSADEVRSVILQRYDMSLGAGLGKLAGKVFRIGHLGHFNDLSLAGTLSGVQMGLINAGVPVGQDGVTAALRVLQDWQGVPQEWQA